MMRFDYFGLNGDCSNQLFKTENGLTYRF